MQNIDERITEVRRRIEDVKKRWPFHSPKPSMFKELEDLEIELDELLQRKRNNSGAR